MAENERAKFLKKLSSFRKDLLEQDWTPDKIYQGGNKSYPYVSAEKTKKNFEPLLVKHGLEKASRYGELTPCEPVGMMSQHWTIKIDMEIFDIDSGESMSYSAYGEAGDSGDKGVHKAQTGAYKQVIFQNFGVADFSDPDGISIDTMYPAPNKFRPKSEEEKVAVKSRIQAKAVPVPPAPPVPKAPAPAPKASVPAPKPVSIKPKASTPSEIPEAYTKAMNAIVTKASMEVLDGTMTSSEVDALKSEVERIQTKEQAEEFIGRHQA